MIPSHQPLLWPHTCILTQEEGARMWSPSDLTPETLGVTHLANPLPIRVPGSRWETRTLRDPDPGSSPVTESSWPPAVATSKALACIWPAPAPIDRQDPGLWEGPRVTAPVGAQMLAPSLQLCTSPPALLPHTLSLSFFQILSPLAGIHSHPPPPPPPPGASA